MQMSLNKKYKKNKINELDDISICLFIFKEYLCKLKAILLLEYLQSVFDFLQMEKKGSKL